MVIDSFCDESLSALALRRDNDFEGIGRKGKWRIPATGEQRQSTNRNTFVDVFFRLDSPASR